MVEYSVLVRVSVLYFCSNPFGRWSRVLAPRLSNVLCSTQVSLKFIMLIKVTMPTIVGILTFICMINTSESLKGRKDFIFFS